MSGGAAKLARLRLPRPPGSLRFQLLSRSLLLLAALLLSIGCVQYVWMFRFLVENKAETIQSQVKTADKGIWAKGPVGASAYDPDHDGDRDGRAVPPDAGAERPFGKRDESHDASLLFNGATVAYIDSDGNWTLLSDGLDGEGEAAAAPKLSDEEYRAALAEYPGGNYRVLRGEAGGRQLVVLQTVEFHGAHGVVQVAVSLRPIVDMLLRQLAIYATLAACALVAAWFVMRPVLRRTLSPLLRLVKLVGQVDAGNLAIRFPERQGQEEIDRLSGSFNSMLARLEASFAAEKEAKERMRRFVADASHELRTPMTAIHGFLQVLLRGAADDAERLERSLASMLRETKRVNRLVEDLLLLARLDQAPQLRTERESLAALLQEMEPQLRLLAGERQLTLEAGADCECRIDADKLKQVVLNLLQNAVEHTDAASGRIRIALTKENGWAVLSVEDNGEGIGPEHLPHIFDRFYRSDASRTRKSGGAGLGLAISRAIVERFGGTIEASSVSGAGSVFCIRLPEAD